MRWTQYVQVPYLLTSGPCWSLFSPSLLAVGIGDGLKFTAELGPHIALWAANAQDSVFAVNLAPLLVLGVATKVFPKTTAPQNPQIAATEAS